MEEVGTLRGFRRELPDRRLHDGLDPRDVLPVHWDSEPPVGAPPAAGADEDVLAMLRRSRREGPDLPGDFPGEGHVEEVRDNEEDVLHVLLDAVSQRVGRIAEGRSDLAVADPDLAVKLLARHGRIWSRASSGRRSSPGPARFRENSISTAQPNSVSP